jgi:glycosyltransferase involved in cell wall biosynthesis
MIHFIIPLYNKGKSSIDNIERLSRFLKAYLCEPYEIILCDDGSTDDTLSQAMKFASSNSHIRVLGYKKNRGRGFAIKFAGSTCLGEYLIYFDLDFPKTTDLFKLIEMIKHLQENDIVIGSRFLAGSQTQRFPLRAFVSKIYRCLVYFILPELKIRDIDVGFKGFRTPCFKEVKLYSKIDRWAWDLEFLTIARAKGMKIKEFPIDWNERHDGYASAVNIFKDGFEEFCGILNVRIRSLKKFQKILKNEKYEYTCD